VNRKPVTKSLIEHSHIERFYRLTVYIIHSLTVDIFCQALKQRDTTTAPVWKKNYL